MIHEFIRLTIVVLSSDNCQTKKKQLSDESSTTVRRINLCMMNIKSSHITNKIFEELRLVHSCLVLLQFNY